jgi:hypothetical protein
VGRQLAKGLLSRPPSARDRRLTTIHTIRKVLPGPVFSPLGRVASERQKPKIGQDRTPIAPFFSWNSPILFRVSAVSLAARGTSYAFAPPGSKRTNLTDLSRNEPLSHAQGAVPPQWEDTECLYHISGRLSRPVFVHSVPVLQLFDMVQSTFDELNHARFSTSPRPQMPGPQHILINNSHFFHTDPLTRGIWGFENSGAMASHRA